MLGRRRIVLPVCVLALTLAASPPSSAGIFDFLFGGFRPEPMPSPYRPRTETDGEQEPGAASYCVRLCDGRYFPVHDSTATQATRLCSALCPATKTKVFVGSDIAQATARDGTRYGDLRNAFVYREKIVDGCTCNGHSPFGLATLSASDDPTLRPGDIVVTAKGSAKSSRVRVYGRASSRELTPALPSGIRGVEAREDARSHNRKHGRRTFYSRHDVKP